MYLSRRTISYVEPYSQCNYSTQLLFGHDKRSNNKLQPYIKSDLAEYVFCISRICVRILMNMKLKKSDYTIHDLTFVCYIVVKNTHTHKSGILVILKRNIALT